jgi:hypothetical protein
MAEFDGLDSRLRDAFAKAAEQGDSTGVADAIRSRIAAGDSGTSVAGGTAPGWGSGVGGWLPWLGLIVLAGIGGTALGASGVFAGEPREILAGYTAVLDDSAPAASCPGGPVIGSLAAGDRVLAIARSEESDYLGVRDPNDFARTLWFDRAVIVVDAGQADVDTLPVEACPVATVTIIEPTPEPIPVPQPGETQAPTLGQQYATPDPFYTGETTTVHAFAFDNVGVTSVSISWSGAQAGNSTMTKGAGNEWTFLFDPPNKDAYGDIVFSMVANDAAGNHSAPAYVTVDYQYFG